jgi:DNA-binding transcriptional regulator YiaG/predicted ATP-dependent protease
MWDARSVDMDETGYNPSPEQSEPRIDPDEIRSLRGTESRAKFAARVGVTPQSVYRWELPPDAAQARRPRGAELARLRALQNRSSATTASTTTPPTTVRREAPSIPAAPRSVRIAPPAPAPPSSSSSSSGAPSSRDRTEEPAHDAVIASLLRALSAESKRGHRELLTAVAQTQTSRCARAVAQAGLAIVEGLLHCDGQRALAAVAGLLGEIDNYPDQIRPWLHAAAATAFAQWDARVLDVGRVQAHSGSIRVSEHPEAWVIGWLASVHAAFVVSDLDLVRQVLARLDERVVPGLPPLLALHVAETKAMGALVDGLSSLAATRFGQVAEAAKQMDHAAIQARARACLAMRQLDDLAAPEVVVAGAQESRAIAARGRLGLGIHSALALRAEAEGRLRLGQVDALPGLLLAMDEVTRDSGIAANAMVQLRTRYASLTSDHATLMALAESLERCAVPSLHALARAQTAYVRAIAHLVQPTDPDAGVRAFEQAERDSETWPLLARDVLLHGTTMRIIAGRAEDAERSLRKLARSLDASPSPWLGAHLRRAEGTLRAAQGEWATARDVLRSATATFELAADRVDAALTRVITTTFACHYGDPGAEEERVEAERLAAELGVLVPLGLRIGIANLSSRRRQELPSGNSEAILRGLVGAVRRMTVRGTTKALLQRELLLVTRELFAGREVRLEEIDSRGHAALLDGRPIAGESTHEELGDGSGRRLRLSVSGRLDAAERAALRVLVDTAGLSLEVSTLRGIGALTEARAGEAEAEIPGFIGTSPMIRRLRKEIGMLGPSRATVIVTGESGSGKEVVARAVHDSSARRDRPYVPFNCATVPRDLFEGQLFGFRRGSFTGASTDHLGVIRAADGGTLFLDEIGELPLDVQPKLLRFLENGEVFPLGAKQAVRVDVRIIAATHRDLALLVREGRFREDLFYRLQVVPLRVPPLRERLEDVAPLARHFVRLLAPDGRVPVLSPDALAVLATHSFPGNVRELRNVIERALAFAPLPEVLHAEHLRLDFEEPPIGQAG